MWPKNGQAYPPAALQGMSWYGPTDRGLEKTVGDIPSDWRHTVFRNRDNHCGGGRVGNTG